MIILDKDQKNCVNRIVLSPNRSISWSLLWRFYVMTCVLSFSIAMLFAMLGYWVVIPFSGLEMLLLGAGLYVTCRNVHRKEVISLTDRVIKLEKGCISVQKEWEFDRYWTRLNVEKTNGLGSKTQLKIGSHGNYIEVGSFLNENEKERLAFVLNKGILTSEFLGHAG